MKTKKILLLGATIFFLSACGNLENGISNVNEGEKTSGGSITTGRVDNSAYQALMKDGQYQTSAARKLNAEKMTGGYNQQNFEDGLLRLSHETFPVDSYYFQEGQKIDEETLRSWLDRASDDNPDGLNPKDEKKPIIFQQLMEQDFIKEDGKTLGGISLGFAFNSVDYSGDEAVEISRDEIMANARKTVNAVLTRVRKISGLEKVPIMVGLFEQAAREDIRGGNYIYSAVSKDGGTTIDQFDRVTEAHVTLPVASGEKNNATQDGLNTKFTSFRDAIQGFFPELAGVTGSAYYVEDQVQAVTMSIYSKYYSKTEITSFTQFIGKQIESIFEGTSGTIEVQINSIDGPQAFIAKKVGEKEVISYVFN
ncbi:CamS family sex pheromone protein [Enterococcus sp. JM9B]|uniref:CamS family sex pheromone protein n=1 Tax=Enterococcus sp. JM9B TaxID=1857216 RepID=UPI00137522D0|nr:CamS family sex pheromone protein [Enterococcus sp. JM9B]KAF1300124.1 hypothetical protein BAU16_12825 [Enterococcus sp. JM9B]